VDYEAANLGVPEQKVAASRELFRIGSNRSNCIIRAPLGLPWQRLASEAAKSEAGSASILKTVGRPEEDPNRDKTANECPCLATASFDFCYSPIGDIRAEADVS
jgi:hypothetical protein